MVNLEVEIKGQKEYNSTRDTVRIMIIKQNVKILTEH
jgi:hypothetical protein